MVKLPSALMEKLDVLRRSDFGQRVAEEEADELHRYFVETDVWARTFAGKVDVIYGPKGSGKSAIYALLMRRAERLKAEGIHVLTGENPRGAPAFKDLVEDPPASESEFVGMWKVYFLSLVGQHLRAHLPDSEKARRVIGALEEAGFLEANASLRQLLRTVVAYVRRLSQIEAVEGGLAIDPATGMPVGVTGKITLREPTAANRAAGLSSVDSVLTLASEALEDAGHTVWILLDRLDVAFTASPELEQNALRALFRTYLDMLGLDGIRLKVFLRTDIRERVVAGGFPEASHITRTLTITWSDPSLMSLLVRRIGRNEAVQRFYNVTEDAATASVEAQEGLFYRVFPKQVDRGPRKATTFSWMRGRTRDGTGQSAPREMIHLLEEARTAQIKRIEIGQGEPGNHRLFDSAALREALPEVSEVRLNSTIYAEYPDLKRWIAALEGQKTKQFPATLAALWGVPSEQAINIAEKLVEIGFFEGQSSGSVPVYWVPFLYRDALGMVQGAAE